MRVALIVLGVIALGLWAFGYVYVSSLACAFGNASPCRIPAPWHLNGEDLTLMVLIPGLIVIGLFASAWMMPRRNQPGS